jgi:hypothetical protein
VEEDVDASPPPKENPELFPLAGVEFPKVEPPAPIRASIRDFIASAAVVVEVPLVLLA